MEVIVNEFNSDFIHYRCSDIENFSKKEKKIIDNSIKRYLIDTGKYDEYRCKCKADYYFDLYNNFDYYTILYSKRNIELDYEYVLNKCKEYEKYHNSPFDLTDYELKICRRMFNNKRSKVRRLKRKLLNIIEFHDCLFLTLTFTDNILDTTSEKTRRVYISRFLRSLCIPFYVANIDYGSLNEREHYHAIIQSDFIDTHLYPYGIINVERVRKTELSRVKLSYYINKISSHAFKDSTGQCRLIYSKKKFL